MSWSGVRGRMLKEDTENLKKKSPTSALFFTLASIKSGDCHIVDVKSAYLQGDKKYSWNQLFPWFGHPAPEIFKTRAGCWEQYICCSHGLDTLLQESFKTRAGCWSWYFPHPLSWIGPCAWHPLQASRWRLWWWAAEQQQQQQQRVAGGGQQQRAVGIRR